MSRTLTTPTARVNAMVADLVATGGHTQDTALRHVAIHNRRLFDQYVAALPVPSGPAADAGALAEFNAAVGKLVATGRYTAPKARAFICRNNPALHQRVIAEANPGKRVD